MLILHIGHGPGMAERDRRRLIAVFQEQYGDLLRFLTRQMGSEHRAADVAQDVYLRLAVTPIPAEDIVDPRAYFFRVARNLAIDTIRRDSRQRRYLSPDEPSPNLADPLPLPEAVVLARVRLDLLDRALRLLPEKPRQALLLSRVEGLPHAAIARRLGVSESMVAKYLAQSLRHCRDYLKKAEREI
jgi:RNA polymerase sigma factor (sigma-70 family)